jgi:hypothetical protein
MYVTGIVPFLLYLSIIINLIFFWYIVKCVKNINDIQDDLSNITNKTDQFVDHLESIHELQMFYGDETLQGMIKHSKQLINDYIDMQEKYFDVDILEEGEDDTEAQTPAPPAAEE